MFCGVNLLFSKIVQGETGEVLGLVPVLEQTFNGLEPFVLGSGENDLHRLREVSVEHLLDSFIGHFLILAELELVLEKSVHGQRAPFCERPENGLDLEFVFEGQVAVE